MGAADTGEVLAGAQITAYFASCSGRGLHIGGDAAARAAAEREVTVFLKAALDLP